MAPIDQAVYLEPNEYLQATNVLREFTVRALCWLAKKTHEDLKDQIIGNFIARGTVCLDSICLLWQARNYQDCWTLHRTLVDRYIHFRTLADNDEFVEFERWSFQQQYRMSDIALSDRTIRDKLQPEWLEKAKALHRQQRSRMEQEPKSNWKRPESKEAMKRFNLSVVYRLGYDYPSTEVHPMADDGKEDFARLVGRKLESHGDERVVLHNSFLVQGLLTNHGLASCSVLWRRFVSDFYQQLLPLLESGSHDYLLTCQKALTLGSDCSWCEPKSDPVGTE